MSISCGGWQVVITPRVSAKPLTANVSGHLDAPVEAAFGEPSAQHLLVELAHAGLRDLGDEGELVGQPPLRDAAAQVLHQLLRAGRVLARENDAAERPLGPARVG